jgi:hypothetical protein
MKRLKELESYSMPVGRKEKQPAQAEMRIGCFQSLKLFGSTAILLRVLFIWLALFAALPPSAALADWMNLTGAETAPNIAEIKVLDDRVRVAFEIHIGDLAAFEALVPDDWVKALAADRPPLADRLRLFSANIFQVVTDDGTKLQANLKLAEPRLRKDRVSPFAGMINPMTRRRVPNAPKDKRVLYAELEYPFDRKPKTLTFIPPTDDKGVAAVPIGFIAYHKAVPIIDFRYLSGSAKVTLDWADPWYTKFDNPNLKRHHKSALMSFLYVEPREVRHEVLIRVRDLQEWADLRLSGDVVINPDEQALVKDRARSFFATRNPLTIDGAPAQQVWSRAEFLNISLTGLKVIEEEKRLDLSTAIIGIILTYPVKHLPKHVSVQWDLFNERVKRIPATAIDPAGPLLGFVEAGDSTFKWQNYLLTYQEPKVAPVTIKAGRSVGVSALSILLLSCALSAGILALRPALLSRRIWTALSVVLAVAAALSIRVTIIDVANPFAGPPDEKISAQILTSVLSNVNHAFIEREPDALRQALAVIVAQDRLGEVQAELGRALAIKVAGGGIARVKAIENLTVKNITALKGPKGFRSVAEWTAKASAGHWGHAHRRTIRFRALVELIEVEGLWKLAGITVVDAKQMSRQIPR